MTKQTNKHTTGARFNLRKFDVAKYDAILARGLSLGLGNPTSQVCIEAAICQTLGLPHGDDPGCVAESARVFKITLNDSAGWSSPAARATGLRDLGLAQLGSKGVVNDAQFAALLAKRTIQVLLPRIFRQVFTSADLLAAALCCEQEGTANAAHAAANAACAAARAAYAASAASAADLANAACATDLAARAAYATANAACAADLAARAACAAARAADATDLAARAANAAANAADATDLAARAACAAARAADATDSILQLSASLALDVLRDLKSPGVKLLAKAPR